MFKTAEIAIQMVLIANCTFELFNADYLTVAGLWGKQVLSFFIILNGLIFVVVEFRVVEIKIRINLYVKYHLDIKIYILQ